MRMILQGQPDVQLTLTDLYLIYQTNSTFNIPQYIAAGYNKLDAWVVGGGGGGGGGADGCGYPLATVATQLFGGGGGGGGGGGALRDVHGVLLSSLSGSNPIVVGAAGLAGKKSNRLFAGAQATAGGTSSFLGLTAHGGGPGGQGEVAKTQIGAGGGGGAGGGYLSGGSAGNSGINGYGGYGGTNNSGGGSGAQGGTILPSGAIGKNGGGASYYSDPSDFGGGGGGGGGRGTVVAPYPDAVAASRGGAGGPGANGIGASATIGNTAPDTKTFHGDYASGGGGGGGGGVSLTLYTGQPNLYGNGGVDAYKLPGGGGSGGMGGTYLESTDGFDGGAGLVVIRVYLDET